MDKCASSQMYSEFAKNRWKNVGKRWALGFNLPMNNPYLRRVLDAANVRKGCPQKPYTTIFTHTPSV